ncbi:MAG: hypothetical protein MI861_28865 [Pirellulales bacterium]|nr:hypothetical protein [Pirellulales bacterium]
MIFPWFRPAIVLSVLLATLSFSLGNEPLPGTASLEITRPLDVIMVEGIDRFALRELEQSRLDRGQRWKRDYASPAAYQKSIADHRLRFQSIIGAIDERVPPGGLELIVSTTNDSLVSENEAVAIHAVRWPVLHGVTAEGLWLRPKGAPIARVVALPDADWTPEMIAGLGTSEPSFAIDLATMGCEVLVPTLISRDDTHSANPEVRRATNQTHREFVYRQAFELGRHVIGYEVQKVLAAVDQLELRNEQQKLPIAVVGVSEGGLLALYSGALDHRIDGVAVSGYFDRRERVWSEPIYRNVWRLLHEFGDAEIASMIAPRKLWIESSPNIVEVDGPPQPRRGRRGAAPGAIKRPQADSVIQERNRAQIHWRKLQAAGNLKLIGMPGQPPLQPAMIAQILGDLTGAPIEPATSTIDVDRRRGFDPSDRQRRQVAELVAYTQRLLKFCHRQRDQLFGRADRSSPERWSATSAALRDHVYRQLIGKLPHATVPPRPRTRRILDDPSFTGYEVVLDVFEDVIAGGILLLPKDIPEGQRRPVVVCQHGLEGTPMHTITSDPEKGFRAYKSFSAELARRGFIVYAPQNPYRGQDAFRTLQRKSNPLGRSLFSYIIPQHLVTLRWLSSLPQVDRDRIGFYGLSYGGKTAVRVPPMLPPTDSEPGYCLSICSADFNEWVAKNASVDARFSYLWTGEYEIFEWNMGHVANYAELSMLMTPRPFMVERGHDDGVGIDEWVAWEYAKVRRHYNKLGLGDRTEIEFFDGPHSINGQGTYRFLHHHLRWPLKQP